MKKIVSLLMVFVLLITMLTPVTSTVSADFEETNEQTELVVNQTNKEELVEDRTEYTKTYDLGNGKYEKRIYQNSIHKKDSKNKFVELSSGLTDSVNPDEITTEETILVPEFKKKMQDGKYVDYEIKDHKFSFSILYGISENGEKIKVKDSKAKYKKKDNLIVYDNIFQHIDLRHFVFESNTKEDLVLSKYSGINEFVYQIETDLQASKDSDGSISFKEQGDEELFSLPKPYMEDSNFDEQKGEGNRSNNVDYVITPNSNGYELRVIADKEWLKSKERKYPVYIDPTTSVNALVDTYVMSAYPNNNYSSTSAKWDSSQNEYILKVGNYDSTTGTNYAYLKFNLSSLEGMQIDSATLKVFVTHHYYASSPNGLWVDWNNSFWDSNLITWNNKPASTNITSVNVGRDQWASLNVTGIVQDWTDLAKSNYGFKLHTNGNGQTYWKKITSITNSTNKPYLSVVYSEPSTDHPDISDAEGEEINRIEAEHPSKEEMQSIIQLDPDSYNAGVEEIEEGLPTDPTQAAALRIIIKGGRLLWKGYKTYDRVNDAYVQTQLINHYGGPLGLNTDLKKFNINRSSKKIVLERGNDKWGMIHILKKHHAKYWNGLGYAGNSFFPTDYTFPKIESAIQTVINYGNNETEILRTFRTSSNVAIKGYYNKKLYYLVVKKGSVTTFYPYGWNINLLQ